MTPDQQKRIKAIEDDTELSDMQKGVRKMEIAAEKPNVVSKVKMPPSKKDEDEE